MSSVVKRNGALADVLEGLTPQRIAEARSRTDRLFDSVRNGWRSLVIFGAGQLGGQIRQAAERAGLKVVAFADNDAKSRGTVRDGVPVLSPRDAVERFGESATFVVGIFNPSRPLQQLLDLGCHAAASYPEFFWAFGEFVSGISGMAPPERIVEKADDINAAYELLDDDASRREFAAQIGWRCTLDRSLLPVPAPFSRLYFDPEIFALSGHEVVVDCGAFNGDTLRALARLAVRYKRYYALEPDPQNREALEKYVAGLPRSQREAITVLPYAVGAEDAEIRFETGFGPASGVSESGETVVSCRRLDGVIDTDPTLIKMDIEGAELSGLSGAAALIARARPVLAVVAYHYCQHLWQIPILIKSLLPDYRLYLRRYAEDCWETVYYALPPGRGLRD